MAMPREKPDVIHVVMWVHSGVGSPRGATSEVDVLPEQPPRLGEMVTDLRAQVIGDWV